MLPELLQNQRIPVWALERGDEDPIVFGGGPVLTANPEPLAPFFDAVLLGDGELLLPAFIDALQNCREAPRAERLRQLAQVPGVYVPCLLYTSPSPRDGLLSRMPSSA